MSEVMKDLILTLRVYSGKITYDKQGNINSDHQTFKLAYGRLEWRNFIKTLPVFGYNKVEVLKCVDNSDPEEPKEVNIPSQIDKEISTAMHGADKPLTPEQQELHDMKAEVAEMKDLLKGKTKEEPKKEVSKVAENGEDKSKWQDKYLQIIGKKPYHGWNAETLENKIEEYAN